MRRSAVATAALALLLAACSAGGTDATTDDAPETTSDAPATTAAASAETTEAIPADGEPIIVGAVAGLTGPVTFPESTQAAQAVFDRVNAQGGVKGRPIEYVVEDDAFDPATSAQAARRIVDSEGAVAMVASASGLDCAVNGAFYAETGVYSIQGVGIDPLCFRSPVISPVNTGPFLGGVVSLYYASEELGHENVCYGAFDLPDWQPAYDGVIAQWSEQTGKELTYRDTTLPLEGDLSPFVLEADARGCDAVVVQANDFHYVAMLGIMDQQGIDYQLMGLTSGYTADLGDQTGATGDGFIVNAEFEPFTEVDSPVLEDWRSLMDEAGISPTSFSQGGYLAATIFLDVIDGMDGEITRESVAEALRGLDSYETDFIGNPYSFGDAEAHNPNRSSKFVQLQDGEWVVLTDEWVTLDVAG